ncbi:MAG: hypothetical protein NUV34_10320, partial [Sulfuricaulis sp.]|nr:hypothetical protein [Sulfuricaulis sp.]
MSTSRRHLFGSDNPAVVSMGAGLAHENRTVFSHALYVECRRYIVSAMMGPAERICSLSPKAVFAGSVSAAELVSVTLVMAGSA